MNGCSDDIEYGVELAESFVDASEKERLEKKRKRKSTSPRAVMNLHNNDAGREVRLVPGTIHHDVVLTRTGVMMGLPLCVLGERR